MQQRLFPGDDTPEPPAPQEVAEEQDAPVPDPGASRGLLFCPRCHHVVAQAGAEFCPVCRYRWCPTCGD